MDAQLLTHDKLTETFKTSLDKGLNYEQIPSLQTHYGYNEIIQPKTPLWRIALEPFRSVFVLILILAAVISIATHEYFDALIVLTTLVINAVIYYVQHASTNRVLHALEDKQKHYATVIRGGNQEQILSRQLVPGDLILLSEGDKIAADVRLIHVNELRIDESVLTGESLPIEKHANALQHKVPINQQRNMAFMGSLVQSGEAKAVVTSIGSETEFGKIAHLAEKTHEKSPVQHKIDKLAVRLTKWLLSISLIVFVLSLLRGTPVDEALRFMLSLTVSSVPEGLPVALTIFMVIGMRRMAKKKALVRSMTAIENLGVLTTIATDKTGTLTKNQLAIEEVWSPDGTTSEIVNTAAYTVNYKGDAPADQLDKAILVSQPKPFKKGADSYHPFMQHLRMSGATWRNKTNLQTYLKGAPENILKLCKLPPEQHKEAEHQLHHFSAKGFRVIALAKIEHANDTKSSDLNSIIAHKATFLGLLAIADSIRTEARQAIIEARKAGLHVVMITGDHFDTAYEIGRKVGLVDNRNQVVDGTSFPDMTEEEISRSVLESRVIARVLPKDKYRILTVLKQHHIAAMTGDGVNDVPALRNAHIGLAMGSGTDAAKEAGDIILLDDNFQTIVAAVKEGRTIYANIQKMLFFLLSTTFGEVISMIVALVFGLPLPVTAAQILWVNLVTSTPMILPLGVEPPEEGIMEQKPRDPEAGIMSRYSVMRTAFIALVISGLTIGVFIYFLARGTDAEAQTAAFCVLVTTQWANIFNARSERLSIFKLLFRPNHFLTLGLLTAMAGLGIVLFTPLSKAFNTSISEPRLLALVCLGSAVATIIAGELFKISAGKKLVRQA